MNVDSEVTGTAYKVAVTSCGACPLQFEGYCGHPARALAGLSVDEYEKHGAPDWCPLRGGAAILFLREE